MARFDVRQFIAKTVKKHYSKRMLIIEDYNKIADLVKLYMEKEGFKIIFASEET